MQNTDKRDLGCANKTVRVNISALTKVPFEKSTNADIEMLALMYENDRLKDVSTRMEEEIKIFKENDTLKKRLSNLQAEKASLIEYMERMGEEITMIREELKRKRPDEENVVKPHNNIVNR